MQKVERHKAILDFVAERSITRQEELSSLLAQVGYQVTQASVSRDLEELGIAKVGGRYVVPERTAGSGPAARFTLVTAGENLIVAKCDPGMASAIAVSIDTSNITEILGTIAGDDTIFIAVGNAAAQKRVIKRLLQLS